MLSERHESPWMNEELRIMREAVGRFLEKEFVPHIGAWEKQGRIDRDAWRKAGDAGLLCASIPAAYGGGGGNFKHEAVLLEELTYAGISGWGNSVHSGIVAHYIHAYGSEEQKQRWLPKMATGELVAAIAMTEPGTGSDLQAVATTAIPDGDDFVLNGQKTFLSNGMNAELICVVAKTDPEEAASGVSLIMLKPKARKARAAFHAGAISKKLGQKAADTAEIFVRRRARAESESCLVRGRQAASSSLMHTVAAGRLIIAVGAVAGIEKTLRVTSDYVKERKAFGKRILDFQNTQFKLAERFTEARVARIFVDDCVERLVAGKLDVSTAAMAKWWTTQKQCEIVDECLQFFGGYGYMMEFHRQDVRRQPGAGNLRRQQRDHEDADRPRNLTLGSGAQIG